jgi:uncharacterized membrane protein
MLEFDTFREELIELMSSNVVRVHEPPCVDFRNYLSSWNYGLRLWTFMALTLAALATVQFLESAFPLAAARWAAGTFLVLFAPGYALVWALFPSRRHPSGLNRFALSVAMSLFMVPAVGMVFNYTPIGIQPGPIAIGLGAITLVLLAIGAFREFLAMRVESPP